MQTLNITYQDTAILKSRRNNARTHSKKQVRQIADSIKQFGFVSPVLIDTEGTVVAGHGRLEAAKLLGMNKVPAIRIDHLTQEQLRALALADNKLALLAGWDENILKIEFQELMNLDPALDLTITGFEMAELDLIVLGDGPIEDDEDLQSLLQPDPVSKRGDLWQLGAHRIICGDALNREDYIRLMEGERAQLVFTDPPYNVKIEDIVGLGKAKHDEFAMASGEMDRKEFISFLTTACTNMASFSADGAIQFICMDWRHIDELSAAGKMVYDDLLNLCVWNKTNGGMGSLYRSKHELVFVFKNGKKPHINNIQLGKHGRYRANVWDYAGQNTFHTDREAELGSHPTVKPVQLVADAILDCSHMKGVVLDPFGGSGTTLIAAEKTGRQARLIEYEPMYVDLTIRRWQQQTGRMAAHSLSGKTFNQMEEEMNND